ncbi:hypothetical protein VTN02DRAFT_782 [Thermoascus thermophilus]
MRLFVPGRAVVDPLLTFSSSFSSSYLRRRTVSAAAGPKLTPSLSYHHRASTSQPVASPLVHVHIQTLRGRRPYSSSSGGGGSTHGDGDGTHKDPDGPDSQQRMMMMQDAKAKQIRAPWHREGSSEPPVRRKRATGSMTRGESGTCLAFFLYVFLGFPDVHAKNNRHRQTTHHPLEAPQADHPGDGP